jgi:hypothetical protein
MEKRHKYTEEELLAAENYYAASDHDTVEETWEYVSEMMACDDYPDRSAAAYRSKLHSVWNKRQSNEQ